MASLTWRGPQFLAEIRKASVDGILAATIVVQREAQETLNKTGGGRSYTKPGGRVHVASAPGQPPAKDLGNLGRSVQINTPGFGTSSLLVTGGVGTDQPYGRMLELGTRTVAPRPWLGRSLRNSRDRALSEIDKRLRLFLASKRRLFR